MLEGEETRLLDEIGASLIATDERGRIAYLSPQAHALLGWTQEECEGRPLTMLMPARMRQRHEEGLRQYQSTHESRLLGRTVRVPALRKDGGEIEVNLTLRMFRRPDGSDLIVANVQAAADSERVPAGVLELETRLQRRAYQLI